MRLLERSETPELTSWRRSVLVTTYGPGGGDDALAAALPLGWRLTRTATAGDPHSDRLIVVAANGGAEVASVRRAHPRDPLLAIVPLMADSSVVVAALEAGADACIRSSASSVVASYLVAMQRRRELERVTDLTGV
jgi:hypothetical protein